jgi:hypothetical protein
MRDQLQFCYSCRQNDTTERNGVVSNNTNVSGSQSECEVSGESSTEELGLNPDLQDLSNQRFGARKQESVTNVVSTLKGNRHNVSEP